MHLMMYGRFSPRNISFSLVTCLLVSAAFWAGSLFTQISMMTSITPIENPISNTKIKQSQHQPNKELKQATAFNITDPYEVQNYFMRYMISNKLIMDLPKKSSQDIYMNYHNMFCNGCDFGPLYQLSKALCTKDLGFSMFIVGANYGGMTKNVLEGCNDAKNSMNTVNPEIYAFEAIPEVFDKLNANSKTWPNNANIHLFNNAVSDKHDQSIEVVSDLGGGGGVYTGGFKEDKMTSRGTVQTVTFDHILKHEHEDKIVDYAVIDVEGFEVNVVWGMKLEQNFMKFPMFQIELGGSWVDKRHSTYWTQGDIAKYFEDLGYDLFLLGGDRSWDFYIGKGENFDIRGCPKLLRVYSEMFYNKDALRGDSGSCARGQEYAQGNLLAVHPDYIRNEIKDVIYDQIKKMQMEVFNHMKYVNYSQPGVRPKIIN